MATLNNALISVGQTLTVVGVVHHDATNFAINLGPNDHDINLHLNPRFDSYGGERVVVCNSYQGGYWFEEVRPEGFPFQPGEEFKIAIEYTPAGFVVTLTDGSTFNFPNRTGAETCSVIHFNGGATINSVVVN